MHHMEIEAGERQAARLERDIQCPMDRAYADITMGESGKVDLVNSPPHYQGKIECIEVLEQLAEQGMDFRILHAIRYLWRYQQKGGAESLEKAVWYIRRVLKGMGNE